MIIFELTIRPASKGTSQLRQEILQKCIARVRAHKAKLLEEVRGGSIGRHLGGLCRKDLLCVRTKKATIG
jgi:hypothetical protein